MAQATRYRDSIAEHLSSEQNFAAILRFPKVREVIGRTLAGELANDADFMKQFEQLVELRMEALKRGQSGLSQPSVFSPEMQPDTAPKARRGNRLTYKGIIEAIEDGRIRVYTQCPVWSPGWRNPIVWNGLHFDIDSMELHLGPVIHAAPYPSIRQQILQFLVLNLHFEKLRYLLERDALNMRDHNTNAVIDRCRKVTLTPENPYFYQLPNEFAHTHSAEIICVADVRQEAFGNKPLLTAGVAGVSSQDRRGRPNNLGAHLIKPSNKDRDHVDEVRVAGPWVIRQELGEPTGQIYFTELDQDAEPVRGHTTGQMDGRVQIPPGYRLVDTSTSRRPKRPRRRRA